MQENRNFFNANEDKSYLLYLLKHKYIKGNTKLVKLIFLANYLAKKKNQSKPFHYHFFNYKYGPYSKWIQNDINNLIISDLVGKSEKNSYYLTEKGKEVLSKLEDNLSEQKKNIIQKVINDYSDKKTKEILDIVYNLDEYKSTEYGEQIRLENE